MKTPIRLILIACLAAPVAPSLAYAADQVASEAACPHPDLCGPINAKSGFQPQQPTRRLASRPSQFIRSQILGNSVWLIRSDGALLRFDLAERIGRIVRPADVIDIAVMDGRLFVLSNDTGKTRRLEVLEGVGRGENRLFNGPSIELPFRLFASTRGLVVIAAASVHTRIGAGKWVRQKLVQSGTNHPRDVAGMPVAEHYVTGVTGDGRWLYASFDAGEWGGTLKRFDLLTGRGEVLSRNSATDIQPDRVQTDCIYQAAGYNWLGGENGSVSHICSKDRTGGQLVFQRVGRWQSESEPVYALRTMPGGFLAFTLTLWETTGRAARQTKSTIYSVLQGKTLAYDTPRLKAAGDLWASWDIPGVMLFDTIEESWAPEMVIVDTAARP